MAEQIPLLTEWQWRFIVKRLGQPAPEHMRERLRQAIENTNKANRQ